MKNKYKFIARSESDPNGDKGGLGFHTHDMALNHCMNMNRAISEYPSKWNTDFWKSKPLEWKIYEEK